VQLRIVDVVPVVDSSLRQMENVIVLGDVFCGEILDELSLPGLDVFEQGIRLPPE